MDARIVDQNQSSANSIIPLSCMSYSGGHSHPHTHTHTTKRRRQFLNGGHVVSFNTNILGARKHSNFNKPNLSIWFVLYENCSPFTTTSFSFISFHSILIISLFILVDSHFFVDLSTRVGINIIHTQKGHLSFHSSKLEKSMGRGKVTHWLENILRFGLIHRMGTNAFLIKTIQRQPNDGPY